MSGVVLSAAAIMALATAPQCGAARPGSEFARRVTAIALQESGGVPLIIGVNADRVRHLPATAIRSETVEQATTAARGLIAQGRSIDLGLMQINVANLARHGLSIETAFDACTSMKAGADHYAGDLKSIWNLGHRLYNAGSVERGAAYAASIDQIVARIPAAPAPSVPAASPSRRAGDLFEHAGDAPSADAQGEDGPRLFSRHGG